MKKIQRTKSVVTDETLHPLYTFKRIPIAAACTDNLDCSSDQFADMHWGHTDSGHIQLMELLDPNLMYDHFHSGGVVGETWKRHHSIISDLIRTEQYENILEVGGGGGELVRNFRQNSTDFVWTIIEPSDVQQISDNRIKYVRDFFENYQFDKKYDTVVHSHCFEHSYYPLKFLNKVHEALTDNGYHYISMPNMKHWLEKGFTNTLSFEHTCYIDTNVLEFILAKTGFEIVDQIIEPHSIFVKTKKSSKNNIPNFDFSYIKENFEKYTKNLEEDILSIKEAIGDRMVYLFGAHTFSQILISMGINQNQIINVLDNDPLKHEKRLYGTNCIVKSPGCLNGIKSPIVVLRAGTYSEEIKKGLLNINSEIIFI